MCVSFAGSPCVSVATNSSQWIKDNFGFFSRFASVLHFYKLNHNFTGVNQKTAVSAISTCRLQLQSHQCFCLHKHVFLLTPLQLETLHLFTPKQLAEMLLLPLSVEPDRHALINSVMDFLLEAPEDRRLMQVLHHFVQMAEEVTTV